MIFIYMKDNKDKLVFLGGTTASSSWRGDLIPKLKIKYFNPVVKDWSKEAQENELKQRKIADYVLYVITAKMEGDYSIAEAIDDSNKQPNKTIFCYLKDDDGKKFNETQIKSLDMVKRMVKENGGQVFDNLNDIAKFLNKE